MVVAVNDDDKSSWVKAFRLALVPNERRVPAFSLPPGDTMVQVRLRVTVPSKHSLPKAFMHEKLPRGPEIRWIHEELSHTSSSRSCATIIIAAGIHDHVSQ